MAGRAPHVSLVQHPESPSKFSATHLGQKKGLAVPFLKLLVPSHLSCPNKLGTIFKNTSESKTKKIFLLLFLSTILAKGMSIYWALQFRKSGMRWDTCSHPRLLAHTDYSQRTRVPSHITGVCLGEPADHSPPGSSVRGLSRQEHWRGLLCPPLGEPPDPGIKPRSLASPALAGGFCSTSSAWEAIHTVLLLFIAKNPVSQT